MAAALQSYDRLIAAGFSDGQARAILDAMSGDLVTREYLDARLVQMETKIEGVKTQLLLAMLAATGVILGSMYFVLPRLVTATP